MTAPVMMIHGAFCAAWVWDGYKSLFHDRGHECVTPELRHHTINGKGRPPSALATTSLNDYMDDLVTEIEELGEPPILIGHSMGGLLAQKLAANGHARALVLLAPSAPWGVLPSTAGEVASAHGLFFVAGDYWNTTLWPVYEVAALNALDRLPTDERRTVFEKFVPESGTATFEIMHWMFDPRRASTVHARDIDCPVLCVAGALDKVNSPKTVEQVARRYRRNATYKEVDGHSHWLLGEPGWEDVAGLCADWLDEQGL